VHDLAFPVRDTVRVLVGGRLAERDADAVSEAVGPLAETVGPLSEADADCDVVALVVALIDAVRVMLAVCADG
jgi:hypothetical protein